MRAESNLAERQKSVSESTLIDNEVKVVLGNYLVKLFVDVIYEWAQ